MIKIAFPVIEISQVIDAPSDHVWRIMTDTRLWPRWGPSVRNVECADRRIKAGSTGRIQLFIGIWATFVITDLDKSKYWSWRVLGARATGHRVETLSTTRCRASFEIPIFMAPYVVVCNEALNRIRKLAMSQHNMAPVTNLLKIRNSEE